MTAQAGARATVHAADNSQQSSRATREFPPPKSELATLANWRTRPFSSWAFRNVRQLLPTANIAAGKTSLLPEALTDLGKLQVTSESGPAPLATLLRDSFTDGFVVMRKGAVAYEWYADGMDARTPHIVFSVSKSICGALGGILAGKDLLDPDKPVSDYVPKVKASVYGTCTVRHLLDMSVGISFVEDYLDPDGDVARYRRAVGWDVIKPGQDFLPLREYLATQKADGKPHGHTFHYVSTNTDLLGWVYERAAGRPLAELISEHIWQPMGAEADAYITLDSEGAMRAAGGICAAPRDLARFGDMIRLNGKANGKQIVPQSWIEDIQTNGDPQAWARGEFAELFAGANYRSKFYQLDRERRTLCCLGIHGQWIYIDPPSETVIVRVASGAVPLDIERERLWRNVFGEIVASGA